MCGGPLADLKLDVMTKIAAPFHLLGCIRLLKKT